MSADKEPRHARYIAALEFAERQVKALIETNPDFFPDVHRRRQVAARGRTVDRLDRRLSRRHDVAVSSAVDSDAWWRERAEHYSKLLEHRQHDRNVHDLGFIFLSTYLPWYELTGEKHLHDVLIQAGRTLAMRFKEKGQYLRSFVSAESLFIDIMMNVPIIFYAANETGDRELARIADRPLPHHARHDRPRRRLDGPRGDFRPGDGQVPARRHAPGPRRPTAPGPAAWPGRCTATASATP